MRSDEAGITCERQAPATPEGSASAAVGPPRFAYGNLPHAGLDRTRISTVERPPQPARSEPREIVELRRLKQEQPDLGSAADLQIQLFQLHRRVQSRVPLPGINLETKHLDGLLAGGKPILAFEQVPIDWSDLRFLL